MKKVIKITIINLIFVLLLSTQAMAFKLPFFGDKDKVVTESVDEEKRKQEEEKAEEERKKQEEAEEKKKKKEEEKKLKEEAKNKDKNYLSVETTISYSSGEEDNWAYGNQKKEFPLDSPCYARVGCTAIVDKFFGSPEEISATYKISGFKNTIVTLSDGIAQKVSEDKDSIVFTKNLMADKRKKAREDVVIFRYLPSQVPETIQIEVVYGDSVKSIYDKKSTIYLK